MNKDRRKAIEEAGALLGQAQALLEAARDEERECFDNMPESLQQGDRGQQAEAAAEALEEACDGLEEAVSRLQDATS